VKEVIEYAVRTIDEYGNAEDQFGSRSGKREAIDLATRLVVDHGETVVVERVVYRYKGHCVRERTPMCTTVWTGGDRERLKAGGWIDDESDTLTEIDRAISSARVNR